MSGTAARPVPTAHFLADTWLNDPNGLVFAGGRFHLFFQCNPYGPMWDNMSWGHAVSTDLVTWTQLPTAIEATDREFVFSGSAVVDHRNTSGLGRDGVAPVVAAYTGVDPAVPDHGGLQVQCLAYSLDEGETWTRSSHNPVLDLGSRHTRDPKVFWYGGDDGHWVMVLVDAEAERVLVFTSPDLHTWTPASAFGPLGAHGVRGVHGIYGTAESGALGEVDAPVWECPDLFPLPVEGTDEQRWVLVVSVNPGGPAGGSGTQYVVGDFDGVTFVADPQHLGPDAPIAWLDHGPDCYAGVTFNDVPDGRRLLIAWADNWHYAKPLAAQGWASGMTLVRELALVPEGEGGDGVDGVGGVGGSRLLLRQRPVLPDAPRAGLAVHRYELATDVRTEIEVGAELRVTVADGVLTCERSLAAVGEALPGYREHVAAPLRHAVSEVTVVVGDGVVEIYADGGLTVLTLRIFPSPTAEPAPGVRLVTR